MQCNVMYWNVYNYCLYVCMHVCMHVCLYVCMYVCMHASMYLFIYLFIYVSIYPSIYLFIWLFICLFIYLFDKLCIYVFMYVRMYVKHLENFQIWEPNFPVGAPKIQRIRSLDFGLRMFIFDFCKFLPKFGFCISDIPIYHADSGRRIVAYQLFSRQHGSSVACWGPMCRPLTERSSGRRRFQKLGAGTLRNVTCGRSKGEPEKKTTTNSK